jgi:hypothetical protein
MPQYDEGFLALPERGARRYEVTQGHSTRALIPTLLAVSALCDDPEESGEGRTSTYCYRVAPLFTYLAFMRGLGPVALSVVLSNGVSRSSGCGLDDRGSGSSNTGGIKNFSILSYLYRLWGTPRLLNNGYRRLFPQGQSGRDVKLTTHLQLVSRTRHTISGRPAEALCSVFLHDVLFSVLTRLQSPRREVMLRHRVPSVHLTAVLKQPEHKSDFPEQPGTEVNY